LTSSSLSPVITLEISEISTQGFTKVEKVSIIFQVFSSNLTRATSIIQSDLASSHVVSRSKATIILFFIYKDKFIVCEEF
jgi:hypothetical protein